MAETEHNLLQAADSEQIARKVKDGSYFEDARAWYNTMFHLPIAERSFTIVISFLALLTVFYSIKGVIGLLPIVPVVPFYVPTPSANLVPYIDPLAENGMHSDRAIRRYLVEQYVRAWEEYYISDPNDALSKRNKSARYIQKQSSPNTLASWNKATSISNPYSPSRVYENRLQREINIVSYSVTQSKTDSSAYTAKIIFDARVFNYTQAETTQWIAEVAFRYTDINISQESDDVTPMTFQVTGYNSKKYVVAEAK